MKASLDNLPLRANTSIIRVVECIEVSSRQIALVVDDARHLLVTVTDGDIRLGILRGIRLDQPV